MGKKKKVKQYRDTICASCFPEMAYLGHVAPGLVLAQDQDGYYLMTEPCHRGDTLRAFDEMPTPDPIQTDNEKKMAKLEKSNPGRFDQSFAWMAVAERSMQGFTNNMGARAVWELVEDCRKAGYRPKKDCYLELWLWDRMGKLIKKVNR